MTTTYDSTEDTKAHINRVWFFLNQVGYNLAMRAATHDQSKLESPEKETFDEFTPKLKDLVYGSEEYRATLRQMKPAIEHHNAHNSHHPEHYENGINGMSLLDLIEMLCDWRAASERNKGGYTKEKFIESMGYQKARFDIDDQLFDVLVNTAQELGYVE